MRWSCGWQRLDLRDPDQAAERRFVEGQFAASLFWRVVPRLVLVVELAACWTTHRVLTTTEPSPEKTVLLVGRLAQHAWQWLFYALLWYYHFRPAERGKGLRILQPALIVSPAKAGAVCGEVC